MIARKDDEIAMQRRRTGVTPVDLERAVVLAKMFRPEWLAAGRVNGDKLAGAIPGDHNLTIAHRARGGQVVLIVNRHQRPLGGHLVLPRTNAIAPAVRGQRKSDPTACRLTSSGQVPLSCIGALHERGMIARTPGGGADLTGDEHMRSDHDRRRDARPGELLSPRDAVCVRPALRQTSFTRDAGARRSTPRRPVVRRGCNRRRRDEARDEARSTHGRGCDEVSRTHSGEIPQNR